MNLNKIDFSDGIRPEEIQENFEILQEQINRERLGVGGYGIASGFDIETHIDNNNFFITVSAASIIDKKGEELFIPECKVDIDLPELYTTLEHKTINYNNTISLKQIPYALSRRCPSEYLYNKSPESSGIYINYPSNNYNTDDYIRVSDIKGTVLTVAGAITREVVVRYNYTADRIDAVYLKNNNTIGIAKGTTSTTPSKPVLPNDCKLLIAYLMIESKYMDENRTTPEAVMYVKEDMRNLRNLYTDKDNNLYIKGTSFDDLQIIHMKEPRDPAPNTLWLDIETNTLFCWRNTDTFSYTNSIMVDTDFDINSNANIDFSTYMDFILDEKELEVYHNGNRLIQNVHYYELYESLPTCNQEIKPGTKGNSFRMIEDDTSGNGLKIRVGDEIRYIIKYRDSHYLWAPVNKMTYVNAKNYRVFCTNDYMPNNKDGYFDSDKARMMGMNSINNYDYKYQYFLFHREKDLDMHFTPNRNELTILINQMILHRDQFEEISTFDLYEWSQIEDKDDERAIIASHAASFYGWTKFDLEKAIEEGFEHAGVGFKLVEPLDSGLNANSRPYSEPDGSCDIYLEAIVERRICTSPIKRKLQRTATFIDEETLIVDDDLLETGIVQLINDACYRYNENQLEVFHNGTRLLGPCLFGKEPDYIEEFGYYLKSTQEGIDDEIVPPIIVDEEYEEDQGYFERKRGKACRSFKINKTIAKEDVITYKITTNVYSYDHINDLIDTLESRLDCNLDTILEAQESVMTFKQEIDSRVVDIENSIEELRQNNNSNNSNQGSFDQFGVLNMSNFPANVLQTMISSLDHINISFKYAEGKKEYITEVMGIREGDYLTVIRKDSAGYSHFLIPNVDYKVQDKIENGIWKGTLFTILNNDNWKAEDIIYITGLKLGYGKDGR